MEVTQNRVNGHYVKTRVEAPWSTEVEHVLTLPLLRMGRHALETHSKPNLSVYLHVQVSMFLL